MTDRFDARAKTLRIDTTNLFKAAPESMRAFQGLVTAVAKDGAISLRTKELMALGISVAIRCEGCILHHVSAALKHGASRQEVVETITVAIEMGGGPSTVYSATALAMFDEVSAT